MSTNCYCHPNHYECPVLYGDIPGFSDTKPNYPVPAIPSRVEYIFGFGLADGVFVRVDDYIVCGAYRDGIIVEGYPSIPCEFDYPDFD